MRPLWATVFMLVAGCSKSEPAGAQDATPPASVRNGCAKDTDCKGDRICETGRCVAPSLASSVPGAPRAGAQRPPKEVTLSEAQTTHLKTVAGPLDVIEITAFRTYEVRLSGRVLVKGDESGATHQDGPQPSFVSLFEDAAGYDQVVVIGWGGMGNACSGYGYSFLGLRKDGTTTLREVPYCGGPSPTIRLSEQGILLEVADHPPNRGTGIIKGERWLFAGGNARRL